MTYSILVLLFSLFFTLRQGLNRSIMRPIPSLVSRLKKPDALLGQWNMSIGLPRMVTTESNELNLNPRVQVEILGYAIRWHVPLEIFF